MRQLPQKLTTEVQEHVLEYVLSGEGTPAVVLINGSGGPIEGWYKIFPDLARLTTTFAYNRPGVGRSSPPRQPQTVSCMTDSLHQLLRKAQVPPPYVLVGHSFGGLIANLFARRYAEQTQGVVMLEATSPDDVTELPQHESALQKALGKLVNLVVPPHPNSETVHATQSSMELSTAPPFPPVPLLVMTGAQPAMAWATSRQALHARARNQAELARLSPLAKHMQATQSGHFPQFSEPELVVSTMADLIQSLRANTLFGDTRGDLTSGALP